jgi:16S rRNA (cytidine1402-2'-O)-methyltransferase
MKRVLIIAGILGMTWSVWAQQKPAAPAAAPATAAADTPELVTAVFGIGEQIAQSLQQWFATPANQALLAELEGLGFSLAAGEAVAVISDAGLPGISDPGEELVAAARAAGRPVVCVPGPSAVTTALVSSGLPTGRFCFEGFLPAKASQRRARLEQLATEERTLVLFEAPHRLLELLEDLLAVLGDRPLRVARELTKRHEEQVGPTVQAALDPFRSQPPQGECTLVLGGAAPAPPPVWDDDQLRGQLHQLLATGLSSKDAARELARRSGHSRRALYALLHGDPTLGDQATPPPDPAD